MLSFSLRAGDGPSKGTRLFAGSHFLQKVISHSHDFIQAGLGSVLCGTCGSLRVVPLSAWVLPGFYGFLQLSTTHAHEMNWELLAVGLCDCEVLSVLLCGPVKNCCLVKGVALPPPFDCLDRLQLTLPALNGGGSGH